MRLHVPFVRNIRLTAGVPAYAQASLSSSDFENFFFDCPFPRRKADLGYSPFSMAANDFLALRATELLRQWDSVAVEVNVIHELPVFNKTSTKELLICLHSGVP